MNRDDLWRRARSRTVMPVGDGQVGEGDARFELERADRERLESTCPEGRRGYCRPRRGGAPGIQIWARGWPLGHAPAPASSAAEPVVIALPVETARAWSRSAIRSSTCSRPTDSRTRSSVTPLANWSSALSWEWVVEAGWMISDLASPTLASRLNRLTASI